MHTHTEFGDLNSKHPSSRSCELILAPCASQSTDTNNSNNDRKTDRQLIFRHVHCSIHHMRQKIRYLLISDSRVFWPNCNVTIWSIPRICDGFVDILINIPNKKGKKLVSWGKKLLEIYSFNEPFCNSGYRISGGNGVYYLVSFCQNKTT